MKHAFRITIACLSALTTLTSFSEVPQLPTEDPPEGALHPLLAETIHRGPFRAQWASLVTHKIPDWYLHDRIGVTAHWGIYSVPGWTKRVDKPYGIGYAEWYWQWMAAYPEVREYHKEHFGDQPYDAFIDGAYDRTLGKKIGFWTSDFNADKLMKQVKDAGGKYFLVTSKHHEGFCIFNTTTTDRNSVKMGPHRDLAKEICDAARRHGLRVGFYFSWYEWFNPHYTGKGDIRAYKGCKPLTDIDKDGKLEYVDDYIIPQIKELIDQYHPDLLYFDGDWSHSYVYWRSREVLAYYYNQAAARGQTVVSNDRLGGAKDGLSTAWGTYGDLRHVEYFANVDKSRPWAMWRGFGNSFGWNRNENPKCILSPLQIVQMMVNCAAAGGNTDFNLGPTGDGNLPAWDSDSLTAMGSWLGKNGNSIYGTTRSPLGTLQHGRLTFQEATSTLYYHLFDWPGTGEIAIDGIASKIQSARILSTGKPLDFVQQDAQVKIRVPASVLDETVTVIALRYQPPFQIKAPWLYPQTPEFYANVQKLRKRGITLVDYHLHIRNNMTPAKAVSRISLSGIDSGLIENHGREWPLSDNEKLADFIDRCKSVEMDNERKLLVGIQVNDRDWYQQIDPGLLKRLDYVVADTMIMGVTKEGKQQRLWLPEVKIDDAEKWMERYMAHNLQILDEPISILANPTYLPACIADQYDTLWTEERMKQIIEKAVKKGIGIEIQAGSPFANLRFLQLAKAMGAKFTVGTNNFYDHDKIDKIGLWFDLIEKLQLQKSDFWTPAMRPLK